VSGMPPMPLSATEELAAAAAMSAEEYGVFLLLRLYQWEFGALPLDEDRLARIAHVATDRWPEVAAAIQPLFGPNWRHEATHQAREKALATRNRLSNAGRKGGQRKAKGKPQTGPAIGQAASQAVSLNASLDASQAASLASARLKPDVLPHDGEASPSAGGQVPYPAIPDPEAARAWLLERDVFPADFDELQRLLMAGKLTPAILECSAP
jgi:uncharacterized protein YdaU (DUF1376 family)